MADEEELDDIFDDELEDEEDNELENVLGQMEQGQEEETEQNLDETATQTPEENAPKQDEKIEEDLEEDSEKIPNAINKKTEEKTKKDKKDTSKEDKSKNNSKSSKNKTIHKTHKILIAFIVLMLILLIGGLSLYFLGYFKLNQLNPRTKIYKQERHAKSKKNIKKYIFHIKTIDIKRLDARLYTLTKFKLSDYTKPKLKKTKLSGEDDEILKLLNQELNDTNKTKKVYKKLDVKEKTNNQAKMSKQEKVKSLHEKNKKSLSTEKNANKSEKLKTKENSKQRIRNLFLHNPKQFVKLIRVITVKYKDYKPFLKRLKRLKAKKAVCKNEYPNITLLLGPFKDDKSRNRALKYIYKKKISSSAFNLGLTKEEFKQICKPL